MPFAPVRSLSRPLHAWTPYHLLYLRWSKGAPLPHAGQSRDRACSSMPGGEGLKFQLGPSSVLVLQQGDLTKWEGDAIVNAANERMLGGGGVDGAIHRAAGRRLYKACLDVPEVSRGVRCPTGEARLTKGFDLPASHVIHTVGPIYDSPEESAPLLHNAYKNSLLLANEHKFKTIAFPAISCGVYGYPYDEAAQVALEACRDHVGDLHEVHFIFFMTDVMKEFITVAKSLFPAGSQPAASNAASGQAATDGHSPTKSTGSHRTQGTPQPTASHGQHSGPPGTPQPDGDAGAKECLADVSSEGPVETQGGSVQAEEKQGVNGHT